MRVTVKLFAAARELVGRDELAVELPAAATIGLLRERMQEACPPLAPIVARAMFAVDATYATDATQIPEGAEIACIPPVSGG